MADEQPSANRRKQAAPTLSGEEARQGRIVLDTRARRWIFLGGLVAFVLLVLLLTLVGRTPQAAAQPANGRDAVPGVERPIPVDAGSGRSGDREARSPGPNTVTP